MRQMCCSRRCVLSTHSYLGLRRCYVWATPYENSQCGGDNELGINPTQLKSVWSEGARTMLREIFAIIACFMLAAACSEGGVDPNSPDGITETIGNVGWNSDDIAPYRKKPHADDSGSEPLSESSDQNTDDDVDSDSNPGPAPETWRFAVMGDSRGLPLPVNTLVLSKLVNSLLQEDVDLVIFTGDTVLGMVLIRFQLPIWMKTMKPLWDAGIEVYPVRGNHETQGVNINSLGAWQNTFVGQKALPTNGPTGHKKVTYSKVHKNAMFIALDQYVKPHQVHQDWLDKQLALAEVPHIFVFGHEPAFKADHEDCLDDFPQQRDIFWNSLKDAGVRAYFCGHDHFYDHARVDDKDGDPDNDVHQFIVGTTGAELYSWSPPYKGDNSDMKVENIAHIKKFGYMIGEVTGPNVTLTWININGDIEDSWSYDAY